MKLGYGFKKIVSWYSGFYSSFPFLEAFPSPETLVNILLPFPFLLKPKPPSTSFLSHRKTYRKYLCQPFAITALWKVTCYWHMMNLSHQSFTSNLFLLFSWVHDWVLLSERFKPPNSVFHSQHVARESNRKSLVWVIPPPSTHNTPK